MTEEDVYERLENTLKRQVGPALRPELKEEGFIDELLAGRWSPEKLTNAVTR